MIITNENLFDEVAEGLQASDLDTILACIVHMTRPDMRRADEVFRLALQRHMILDFMGMQETADHQQIVTFLDTLGDQIDRSMVGVFN